MLLIDLSEISKSQGRPTQPSRPRGALGGGHELASNGLGRTTDYRSPSRKALLLVMANYSDQDGFCWPSQETLAAGAEISLDTVQRQSKKLHEMELIKIERLPKRRGQWQRFCYRLDLSKETRPPKPARPQFSRDKSCETVQAHHAGASRRTGRCDARACRRGNPSR